MAVFSFNNATLRLSFVVGTNAEGEPVEKKKTYRNIKNGAQADALVSVSTVLAGLSSYPMSKIEFNELQEVVGN
ncbi:DUF1659 domain-containing protein [Viridibacillus sp. YIM B01967]|uniref:DUF1659 domain-containing protein n=1 Tax=Viridibacillus soli TaxID=2798301 RepID=A0ABS1H7C5_9BACL|nr:DUF1659 domain-containing protein [Viridibacillus soli]MBK3495216.1 DUF1659 domain-containing protein [Viridibacillus soli]